MDALQNALKEARANAKKREAENQARSVKPSDAVLQSIALQIQQADKEGHRSIVVPPGLQREIMEILEKQGCTVRGEKRYLDEYAYEFVGWRISW